MEEIEVAQSVPGTTSGRSHTIPHNAARPTESEATIKTEEPKDGLNTHNDHVLVQNDDTKEDNLKDVQLIDDETRKAENPASEAVTSNSVNKVVEEEQSEDTHHQVACEVLEEDTAQLHNPFDQEDLVTCNSCKTLGDHECAVSVQTTTEATIAITESQSGSCSAVLHPSESTKDILMVFGVTVKTAAEILVEFVTDERSIKEKSELGWSTQILRALEEVMDICEATQEVASATEHIALYVTEETHILYAFYGFLTVFPAFYMGGVNEMLVNGLMMVHTMIAEWTYSSKIFCDTIVEKGLMVQHIDELQMLQKASKSIQIASKFAEINLNIIYNCSRVASIQAYFTHPKYDCGRVLMPFTQSPETSIRTHAIFVLTHLATLLSSQSADLIQPCPEIMNNMLRIFEYASTTNNHTVSVSTLSRVMSIPEIVHILENLQTNEENYKVMIERDLIPTIMSLLAVGGVEELKSVSRLVWRLLRHSSFREKVYSSDLPIAETIQMLCDTPIKELKQLFLCTRVALEGINEEDTSLCLDYAEGCYNYGYYLECENVCENLIKRKFMEDESNQASCLLGKAKFHLYRRERLELRCIKLFKQQYTREYQEKHKQCYDKAKVVIGSLGAAMDKGLLENKEEELRMLDVAMIDYFQETKKLDRCLLCRRRTRLLKSHFFPKCLLKEFCSGLESGDDQRILLPSFYYQGAPKSPKEIAYFMFCQECEQFLSKHGENQFRSQFFSHIYNSKNPLQRIAEQCIEYDEWLYEFCLGIILRGLAVYHQDGFFNCDKIHELYQNCREFLLNPNPSCQGRSPTVALIMSPLEKSLHEDGIPNEIVPHAFVQYWHLDTGLDGVRQFGPPLLHSFVVHFGEINVVAVVNERDIQNIPDGCLITRNKGKYTIPSEKSRWNTTPKGIIKGMQRVVKVIDEAGLQLGSRYLEEHMKKKQAQKLHMVPDQLKDTFLIAPVSRTAGVDFTSNLEKVPSEPMFVNLLPNQFIVSPPFINLPKGHRILIHACLGTSEDASDIMFIAIGNCAPYTPARPYLIHHQYRPHAKISMGYFINPTDCSAQEFLPDKYPKQMLKNVAETIKQIQSECPQLLSNLMQAKGFINLLSLLKHAQANSDINYDIKCNKPHRCQYCSNLCDICLKPASFGLSREEEDGSILRFCSEACQATHKIRYSPIEREGFTTEVWILPSSPPPHFRASPVSSDHRVLLYINAKGKSVRGNYVVVNVAVCYTGDTVSEDKLPADKLYVSFVAIELDHPMYIEFFITDDGKPDKPLPYCLCPTSVAVTERFRNTNEVQDLISNALLSKGVPNLSFLKYNGKKECNVTSPSSEGVDQTSKPENIQALVSHQLCIDALPADFVILQVANHYSIKLPEGHQILLHETFSASETAGDTLFIAVSPCDKPYLIHHHHDPHVVINIGYFISPTSGSVGEFLSDAGSPKQALKDAAESAFIREMRSQYPQLLPQMIQSKGFINLASLLKHAQTQRDVNFDTKCSKERRCWYCPDLCEICLKPGSSVTLSRKEDSSILQFCSKSCQSIHEIRSSPAKPGEFTIEEWMPPSAPPPHFRAFPMDSNDRVLLSIYAEGGSARGNCTQINMAVCAGDGGAGLSAQGLYVAYVANELEHQMFIEFFVTSEGEPKMPLPYCLCPNAIEQIEIFHKTAQVQKLICAVLHSKGIPNLIVLAKSSL